MSRRIIASLCACVTILFWAGSFPAISLALEGFEPLPLAALRFVIATIALLVAVLLVGGFRSAPRGVDALWCLFCGFLGIALYNFLLNTGQQTVAPGAASFLIATQPVFSAIIATVLFQERFGPKAWFGTLICLGGAAVLALGQPGDLDFGGGAPLIVMAAICSGSFFAFQRPLIARYGPFISGFSVVACGALWLLPWLPTAVAQLATAPMHAIAALVFLGLFPGALAYLTWMVAVGEFGAPKAANLLFVMAPTAALLSIPLVGSWPNGATIMGGSIALVGVLIVHRQRSPFTRVHNER